MHIGINISVTHGVYYLLNKSRTPGAHILVSTFTTTLSEHHIIRESVQYSVAAD